MIGLTKKQRRILDFIHRFALDEGMPPTVYEIADKFGIKTSTVHAHLVALQGKGAIERSSKARSIKVNVRLFPAQPKGEMLAIPLLGRISAGQPLLAQENREGEIYFSPTMLHGNIVVNRLFALKVNGESMRDAGILDGDHIVVQQTHSLKEGDIVVALVDDETTVKSYFRTPDGKIELRPANPDFQSRFFTPGDVLIQGRVLGLQRSY
jgi:repressor LexA